MIFLISSLFPSFLSLMTFSLSFSHLYLYLLRAIMFAVGYVLLGLILPPPLSLSDLFLPLLFLVFVFGRGRFCRCHVFGETYCVLPLHCRIASSTWASWGFSEQLASSSCWDRERPSVSCYGPSSSPLRYSIVKRHTHNVQNRCFRTRGTFW